MPCKDAKYKPSAFEAKPLKSTFTASPLHSVLFNLQLSGHWGASTPDLGQTLQEDLLGNVKQDLPSKPALKPITWLWSSSRPDLIISSIISILPTPHSAYLHKDILKIIQHLARHKNIYPTGAKKKLWLSDKTVAAIVAGVWNVAAHNLGATMARSVSNLLSIHTMVLFMDKLGS